MYKSYPYPSSKQQQRWVKVENVQPATKIWFLEELGKGTMSSGAGRCRWRGRGGNKDCFLKKYSRHWLVCEKVTSNAKYRITLWGAVQCSQIIARMFCWVYLYCLNCKRECLDVWVFAHNKETVFMFWDIFWESPLTGDCEGGCRRERTLREDRSDERKGKLPFLKWIYIRTGGKPLKVC